MMTIRLLISRIYIIAHKKRDFYRYNIKLRRIVKLNDFLTPQTMGRSLFALDPYRLKVCGQYLYSIADRSLSSKPCFNLILWTKLFKTCCQLFIFICTTTVFTHVLFIALTMLYSKLLLSLQIKVFGSIFLCVLYGLSFNPTKLYRLS